MTDRNIPTDLVVRLRKARFDIMACDEGAESGQCALLREAADMLERAQSIISIREAGMKTAKGQAWLAQLEGRPYV